jgi:tetratricopeptide (TPR) repeat protein
VRLCAKLTLAILVALSPACDKAGGGRPAPADAAAEPLDPLGPPSQAELPTTDGTIAIGNLNGQIDAAERALAKGSPGSKQQLVDLLATRARYLARIADLERASTLAEELVKDAPKDPSAYVTRASMRATMHRFTDALADLAEAEKLGAKAGDLVSDRASIVEGQGDLEGALALRHAAREARATIATLGTEAALIGRMGKTTEADALFRQAMRSYRGVSPLPVAWLLLQQGLMWESAGNAARARAFFQAAMERLPTYGHAVSHLATLVPPARGVEVLKPIVEASDDPELGMVLAARMRSAGDVAGADKRLAHVRARYEELVKKHPEAYAEHAGWFWLDEGKEPGRALDLAKKNLAVRRTEKAYRLAVLAAVAAGAQGEACAFGREADKAHRTSEMLRAIAADACKQAVPR